MRAWLACAAVVLGGCSSITGGGSLPPSRERADAGGTRAPDTGPSPSIDAGPAASTDAGPAGGVDAGPARPPDAGPPREPDAGPPPRISCGDTECEAGTTCCFDGMEGSCHGPDVMCMCDWFCDPVTVRCDEPGDCRAGQVCCATRNPGDSRPETIVCAESCMDGTVTQRDEICSVEDTVACRNGRDCVEVDGLPPGYRACDR